MRAFIVYTLLLLSITNYAQQKKSYLYNNETKKGLAAANYTFNLGSSVGFANKETYWISNYIAPSTKFDVTKRISIIAGIGVKYSQINNLRLNNNEFEPKIINARVTSLFSYASGIYKLNEKVDINASVIYNNDFIESGLTPTTQNKQYKDVSIGFNYKVSNNISINGQMKVSDQPYRRNNFGCSNYYGINSPFGFIPGF